MTNGLSTSCFTANKPRITSLVLNLPAEFPQGLGLGELSELRDASRAFRQAGKKTIAYVESAERLVPYWLASVCEEIYVTPAATIGLTGLCMDVQFLKGLLEKLDIKMDGGQRKAYKNAYNAFTQESMTSEHRESADSLLTTINTVLVSDMAASLNVSADDLLEIFKGGPFNADEALSHKLITGIAYESDVSSHHLQFQLIT